MKPLFFFLMQRFVRFREFLFCVGHAIRCLKDVVHTVAANTTAVVVVVVVVVVAVAVGRSLHGCMQG